MSLRVLLYLVAKLTTLTGMGRDVSEQMAQGKTWDSNAITPGQLHPSTSLEPSVAYSLTGTPFMDLLAASMRYWVARKLNTDPGWRDVRCCRSSSPGLPVLRRMHSSKS